MEYNREKDISLFHLMTEYEEMTEKGKVRFKDEVSCFTLISYYEKEFLYDKALEVVEFALQQYKTSSNLHIRKAQILLALNQFEAAMKVLDKVESFSPKHLDILLLRARVYASRGDFSLAFTIIEEADQVCDNRELSAIFLCTASVYEYMKDFQQSFEYLKKSLVADPMNDAALERFWVCSEITRKFDECIAFLNALIDECPYSSLAWYNLGNAYSCTGQYEMAIEAYEYSFIIDPKFKLGYVECAEICLECKNYKKALALYEEIIDVFGIDEESLTQMGFCQLNLGQYEEAKKTFKKAIKLDPYDDEIHFYLGKTFAKEKQWISSINAYRKAIDIEDRREDYYTGIARSFYALKEYSKAQYYYAKATEIGADEAYTWKYHASFLISIDETAEAIKVLENGYNECCDAELLYMQVALLFALKQNDKAVPLLREALEDHYDQHGLMFKFDNAIKQHPVVQSMISYYRGEQ